MKLLICATEYPPGGSGIANVVSNIIMHLKEYGVECTVCSPTGPDVRLGSEKLIARAGIIGLLYYWKQVSHYLRKNEYDVVWLHNPLIVDGSHLNRILVTMHSTYYGESVHHVGNSLFLIFYKKFAAVIEKYCLTRMNEKTLFTGVGKSVCEELEKIGIPRERVIYIPNGVNTRQFHPSPDKKLWREKYGIPEKDTVLLSVGRLTPAKQPHTLIKVFSCIERKIPDVTLCIVGKGELFDNIKNLADKWRLRKVLFLGYVDLDDLFALYKCADYFIITSKYEGGMPVLTVAEAMASGLPCIVSNIPNFEFIRDADCGIIVDFSDPIRASNTILDYLHRGSLHQQKNAREYAVNYLDWKIISKKYLQVMEMLCDR